MCFLVYVCHNDLVSQKEKGPAMTIKQQILDYIQPEFVSDFDVDSIVDEIDRRFPGIQDVDDIDTDEFIDILESFDISE